MKGRTGFCAYGHHFQDLIRNLCKLQHSRRIVVFTANENISATISNDSKNIHFWPRRTIQLSDAVQGFCAHDSLEDAVRNFLRLKYEETYLLIETTPSNLSQQFF